MKIVYVNNIDVRGNRFNGYDLQITLNQQGIQAKQFVMDKLGNNPNTISLERPFEEPFLRNKCMEFEKEMSIQGLIYPYGWRLLNHPDFKNADLVHYHLLHNYFISFAMLPKLVSAKPAVLTIHDPWLFSGHCIYSVGCEKWKTGCGNCPNLDLHFPMSIDNTENMWKMKQTVFSNLDIDIIVASKYMLNLVKKSPITAHMKHVHLIPFGINVNQFTKQRNQKEIRQRLKIQQENFVIFFRADESLYKGCKYIKEMLDRLKFDRPVTLLTVGNKALLSNYSRRYQIVDFDWITDDELMADLYCACDLFLMPSMAEAFGLMAIEAMASSKPVVVFEGTSLPDVTFAPECGIAVPQGDSKALADTVERLLHSPEECKWRGEEGRRIAEKEYRYEDYVNRHLKLYQEILNRKN